MPEQPHDGDRGIGLFDLPEVVLDEVLHVVPRLIERTQAQVDLARRLAGHLPCLGGLLGGRPSPAADTTGVEPAAPVDVLQVVALRDDEGDDTADEASEGAGPAAGADAAVEPAAADVPTESELPVPDYDSLAASQVVPRLAALSTDELATVGAYERAHRNRQTILNKVKQLQAR